MNLTRVLGPSASKEKIGLMPLSEITEYDLQSRFPSAPFKEWFDAFDELYDRHREQELWHIGRRELRRAEKPELIARSFLGPDERHGKLVAVTFVETTESSAVGHGYYGHTNGYRIPTYDEAIEAVTETGDSADNVPTSPALPLARKDLLILHHVARIVENPHTAYGPTGPQPPIATNV